MKSYLITLLILFVCSCSTKKETNVSEQGASCPMPVHENLDSLLSNKTGEKPGAIKLKLKIDTFEYSGQFQIASKDEANQNIVVRPINKIFELNLEKESDLLIFGKDFGIKLFHSEPMEYGSTKHLLRYDFFIKQSEAWRRYMSSTYCDIDLYLEDPYYFGFAIMNDASSKDYLRLVAGLTRAD